MIRFIALILLFLGSNIHAIDHEDPKADSSKSGKTKISGFDGQKDPPPKPIEPSNKTDQTPREDEHPKVPKRLLKQSPPEDEHPKVPKQAANPEKHGDKQSQTSSEDEHVKLPKPPENSTKQRNNGSASGKKESKEP